MTRHSILRASCALCVVASFTLLVFYVIGSMQQAVADNGLHGDFPAFFRASVIAWTGGDLYAPWDGPPYIYPPFFASAMAPFTPLGALPVAIGWTLCSALLVMGAAALSGLACSRAFGVRDPWVVAIAPGALALLLVSDRLKSMFRMGQTDSVIMFGVALSLWALPRNPMLVGLGIGLGANFKYLTLAFVPWMIARRRWKELGWAVVFGAVFALSPSLVLGWERNLSNLGQGLGVVGRAVGHHAAGAPPGPVFGQIENISIPEGLFRMFGSDIRWRTAVFAAVGAIACIVIAMVWVMYRRAGRSLVLGPSRDSPEREVISAGEWCCVWAAALCLSPGICTRHLVMLAPVFAMVTSLAWHHLPRCPTWWIVAAVLWAQACWARVPVLWHEDPKLFAREIGLAGWGVLPLIPALAWAMVRWRPIQGSLNNAPDASTGGATPR